MKKFITMMIMHLQLFANELQTTLLDGLSAEMKTFYDMTLIDEAQASLVHDQFGQKRPIPKNGGKTIEFRKFAALAKATTPLVEGVTPDGKGLTVTTITATVNQYGDYITQSDVLELTSLDNTILEATKLLGRQAGLTLDTIVRNVMQSVNNVTYCPKVAADGTYTPLVDYNSANYWCTEMGNFRVKGDINGDALIMAYICVGTGHYAAWEVKGGVVGEPVYGDLHDGSWDASTGVFAAAGATVADGFYAITYGATYNLNYYDGTSWTETYVTGSSWMENYNCISTAEVNGNKYLALTASCHFDYDYTDIIVLDVTDLTAVKEVFKIQMNFHTVNAGGLTYSDIYIKGEDGKLAAYVVDSWMDTVEKYLFPLE